MTNRSVIRGVVMAAFAVVLLSTRAAADGPNTYPGGAVAPIGQWTMISANQSLWYNFDYAGDRSKVEITLQNGFINNLAFNLYTPDQISLPSDFGSPIGKGTPQNISCDTGKCFSDNLLWAGDFFVGGTFYVEVKNLNSTDKPYMLLITGSGVTTHPLPAPVVVPYVYSPPATYSYPAQSAYLSNGYYPGQLQPPMAAPYGYSQPWPQSNPTSGYYSRASCYYRVNYGDTLFSIAGRYGTDTWQLVRANGLPNANLIFVGQSLLVPNCR